MVLVALLGWPGLGGVDDCVSRLSGGGIGMGGVFSASPSGAGDCSSFASSVAPCFASRAFFCGDEVAHLHPPYALAGDGWIGPQAVLGVPVTLFPQGHSQGVDQLLEGVVLGGVRENTGKPDRGLHGKVNTRVVHLRPKLHALMAAGCAYTDENAVRRICSTDLERSNNVGYFTRGLELLGQYDCFSIKLPLDGKNVASKPCIRDLLNCRRLLQ